MKFGYTLAFIVLIASIDSKNSYSQSCLKNFEIATKTQLPGCYDNGKISVQKVEGGTPPYGFRIRKTINASGIFTDLSADRYMLYVTDANNCLDSIEINLIPNSNKKLFSAPNAFSPNGDHINDRWNIKGVDRYRGVKLSIYNKWGQEVFSSPDYKNEFAWNGKKGNSELPEATYYYIITVLQNCREINQSGTVTIVR